MIENDKKLRYLKPVLPILAAGILFFSVLLLSAERGDAVSSESDLNYENLSHFAVDDQELGYTLTTSSTVFLPTISKNYPWISPFGVEVSGYLGEDGDLLDHAVELDTNWVRMNNRISWREMQPVGGGEIKWSVLENFEKELMALREHGATPVVIIDDHPDWAVKPFEKGGEQIYSSCAAIKIDKLPAFANFVRLVVKRYSAPQYGVHNWEFGNEPDVDPRLVAVNSNFGCWGDIDDPFYGGRHYGEMLKVVTPVIKAVDPIAKVWVGGLLLNSPSPSKPDIGNSEKFLAGILESRAASFFDVLAYHAYFGYNGQPVDQDNGNTDSSWYPWGGMVVGKANFLRQEMTKYGIEKPVFLDELALNCPEYVPYCESPDDEFWQIQADQLVRSMTRGLANQVMGFTWYTLDGPGWRNGGLLDENQDPRPSYDAYKILSEMLLNTKFLSPRNYGSGIEAYRFHGDPFPGGPFDIDVLWAKEDQNLAVVFTKTGFVEARSRDGLLLTPSTVGSNYQLQVGFSPIYIIFEQ